MGAQAATAIPTLPEQRLLTLEYPPEIHAGDSHIIRLTLEADKEGNLTPTAVVGGHKITGERVEISNLYETPYHHWRISLRFSQGLQGFTREGTG